MKKGINILKLAELAGVSKSTVSRALSNSENINEETKRKILKLAEENHYQVNTSARLLRSKTNKTIGVMLSKEWEHKIMSSPSQTGKLSGILSKISMLGYDLLMIQVDYSDKEGLLDILRNKNFAGILIIDYVEKSTLEMFHNYNIPFVLVNWSFKNYENQNFIQTNLEDVSKIAVDYLWEKGYKDIILIKWTSQNNFNDEIEEHFIKNLEKRGIKTENSVISTEFVMTKEELNKKINYISNKACFCLSYVTAMNIIKYCNDSNINVPNEIALLSYDHFYFFDYLSVPLTSIAQEYSYLGSRAVEILDAIIKKPFLKFQEYVTPKLIIGKSC